MRPVLLQSHSPIAIVRFATESRIGEKYLTVGRHIVAAAIRFDVRLVILTSSEYR